MNSRKMAMVMLATVLSSLKVLAQEEGDVNERALKYGVINFEFPPYLYYDKETNLPYKGFFYDVLQGFGKQLNRTIEMSRYRIFLLIWTSLRSCPDAYAKE